MTSSDLSTLEVLDEISIVRALKERFNKGKYYTYVGDILVAVNPCKPIPLFDGQHHYDYNNVIVRASKPPHLFWVADHAYRELKVTGRNQVILVSGESGAGKTESTKYMIRHLMHISPSEDTKLLDKIVQVNPLLEAFGNACTVINGNSSRFGKFIELSYTFNGTLLGAKINDYILEKSRVVHRSYGEKNFHVFYALFAGMSRERLLYYFLEDPECHRIMRDAEPALGVYRDSEEFDYYKKMFHNLTDIMLDVGFSDEHITLIFLILAAILHLANIVFVPCEDTDGVSVDDEYPLHAVAKLLGIEDEVHLTEALISTVSYIKDERIQSWKNLREANDSRDALVKELYSRLFGWVVGQVNRNLWTGQQGDKPPLGASIGLLDMSGFENFPNNGFDQFLINVTNEKLQQYFMEYIFPQEQMDYEREGIRWTDIQYRSNDDILTLIFQKPHGIMPLLDEESNFPQSTDSSLVHKLKQYCTSTDRFLPARGNKVQFGINHYAETVVYDANGFLERNRDKLNQDLVACLLNSNNDFIQNLFTASMSDTGSISECASRISSRPKLPEVWPSAIDPKRFAESLSRKASLKIKNNKLTKHLSTDTLDSDFTLTRSSATVTRHFKRSLSDLMNKLSLADPLFVRCVKPNHHLSSDHFDSELIGRQLRCNGLMELAQLRRDGFPVRIHFPDFIDRYGVLLDEDYEVEDAERSARILNSIGIEGYQIGKSKVFLKTWHKDELEYCLREKLAEIERIERELERKRQIEIERRLAYERQMQEEEEERRQMQRQQEEIEELERRRASHESLLSMSGDNVDFVEPSNESTPRKPSDSGIVYTDTAALLKEKLSQLSNNEDGLLESIGRSSKRPAPNPPPRHLNNGIIENGSLPPKRQMSEDSKSTTTGSYESEGSNEQWRPYDIFQISEREFEESDAIFKEILKLVRLFMYFFLFCAILGGAVVNRLSIMVLVSGINKDTEKRGEYVTTLLFCICGPLAYNWFMSLMKTLFGGKEWPSIRTTFILLIIECLQSLGACLVIFRILPSTDIFRGIIVTFAICQIPSLLKVIVLEKRPNPSVSEIVCMVMNITAFLVQVVSIPFFSLGDFMLEGNHTILEGVNSTDFVKTPVTLGPALSWELPVGLILMSLGFWENYVSGDWSVFGKIHIPFKQWRKILQDSRDTACILVYPWKIGFTILLSRLLTYNTDFKLATSDRMPVDNTTITSAVEEHFHCYSLMYLQIGSGIVISYLSGLVCKLHMQKMAFSLPIMLAPPVSLAVVYFQCSFEFIPAHWHMGGWMCGSDSIQELLVPLICATVLWFSYAIIAGHIWFPQSERMAKLEKLFITPHFVGLFPDFSLTLKRRRNDREIRLTGFDTFRYVGEDIYGEEVVNTNKNTIPTVYVCATMWHETRQEMTQLLKSLFRLDYVHCASRLAQEKFRIKDPDYYDLDIHIIVDDAFELNDDVDKYVPNHFVKQLVDCLEDAARSVVKGPIVISPPTKMATPYGGRLVWTMPGHTKLNVHLKDKNKIRHRKRWSQCMYMYYLLGFRLFGSKDTEKAFTDDSELESRMSKARNRKKGRSKKDNLSRPIKSLFNKLDTDQYEKAENTFILTLDGDVDFRPESVKLLIDRMKKNRKVGAVCGRIHPIGSGPMVWYQQFEYAVGHWLQKAAEHVFGCVLCCPGCFSLFRGSALMDDNVMKMYTTKPTEARHYIQFEQGEDRWLCTLLLQQGHRIDYCAGADALTFAPETFNEFFNQRRRWAPSTLANMMDLLSGWHDTVRINDNISRPYVLYQFILMASTILAPSTIILMITGSYHSVLGLAVWESYLLSIFPVAVYIVICMTMKNDHQITAAAMLSAVFTVVMMIATVGTIISIVTENFGSPNVVFLTGLVSIFTIAGILHPQEFFCLVYGLLYFLTVPSTFILLTVYYLCNLNNVSWGTRETPKKMTKEEIEEKERQDAEKLKKKESKTLLHRLGFHKLISDLRVLAKTMMGIKVEEHEVKAVAVQTEETQPPTPAPREKPPRLDRQPSKPVTLIEDQYPTGWEPNPERPYWFHLEYLGNGAIEKMEEDETDFWRFIIHKYLHPLDEDKSHKEKIANDLITIKNNVVFIYFMINFLWTVITLQLQSMEDKLKSFYIINKYEPLSLMFLSVFAFCITLQFISMFVHRWGTFLHLMSSTRIDWFKNSSTEEDFVRFVVAEAQRLQRLEPAPDYDELPPDYDDEDDDEIMTNGTIRDTEEHYNQLPVPSDRPQRNTIRHTRHKSNKSRYRNASSNSNDNGVPLLQQIFEDRLENIHRKWKKGTLTFHSQRKPGRFDRNDSNRLSNKLNDMRQRMFKRSFKKNSDDGSQLSTGLSRVVVETL